MILYRDARADDLAYIREAWLACLLQGPDFRSSDVSPDTRQKGFEQRIARLLQRSAVRVACDSAAKSSLVGFAVYEGNTGHFRYVRKDFRSAQLPGVHIAQNLIPHRIITCSHRSQGHAPGRMKQSYNPFLLETP